jgi:hypothetical protein
MSAVQPYAEMIGREYEVVVDGVALYGIYDFGRPLKLGWMTVVPDPGVSGSSVAFRCQIPRGQRFRIVAVWRSHALVWNDFYHVIEFVGAKVPENVPIQLELFRGNEGRGVEPNAALYWRLDRTQGAGNTADPYDHRTFTCPEVRAVPDHGPSVER